MNRQNLRMFRCYVSMSRLNSNKQSLAHMVEGIIVLSFHKSRPVYLSSRSLFIFYLLSLFLYISFSFSLSLSFSVLSYSFVFSLFSSLFLFLSLSLLFFFSFSLPRSFSLFSLSSTYLWRLPVQYICGNVCGYVGMCQPFCSGKQMPGR